MNARNGSHKHDEPNPLNRVHECAALALLFVLACLSFSTHAGIYKCLDTDGNTSYSQVPCPVEQSTAKVMNRTSASEQFDCRIANNFARRTATEMRAGQSSGDVFAAYGGIDAMPRTSVGIVNYVYTHRQNTDTSTNRITALSAARCSGGSYGSVSCDDFPYSFIAELGGCEMATQANMATHLSPSNGAAAGNAISSGYNSTQSGQQLVPAALGARTHTGGTANADTALCQQQVQRQMNELILQMGSAQSASAMDALNSKRHALSRQLSDC